jgi:hypothetical protein
VSGTAVVPRDDLRRQRFAFEAIPVAQAAMTCSATSILHQEAKPNGDMERVQASWRDALSAITDQNWGQFVTDAGNTVSTGDGAYKFFEGIGAGAVDYLKSELDGYVEMGSSVGGWVADGSKCAYGRIKSFLWRDEIADARACKGLKALGKSIEDAVAMLRRLDNLSYIQKVQLFIELCKVVMEVFGEVLKAILQWAADQREAIKAWLEKTARDAKKLGSLAGSLLTALILEYVTAGAGRALKGAKTISKLADPPGPLGLRAVGAKKTDLELLDDLFDLMQKTLNKNRARFSRNVTLRKLGLIRAGVSDDVLKEYAKRRARLNALLGKRFGGLRNRIATHADNVAEAKEFNRRWLTLIYGDALVDNADADPFLLLAHKDSAVSQLFESNHIVEQRIFQAATGKLKDDFARLGWTGPNDMPAILLPSSQHTASIKRMFERYQEVGLDFDEDFTPGDLKALTVDTQNLTQTLMAAVKVGPDSRMVDVLGKYREVYKTFDGGALWTPGMEASFAEWIVKLGGTP